MSRPPDTADEILGLFRPLAHFSVGLTGILDETFGTDDASDSETLAILALIFDGTISSAELRRRSGLSRRAHSRLIDQLLRIGVIDQARAIYDARVHLLTLTRRGAETAHAFDRRVGEFFRCREDLARAVLDLVGEPSVVPPKPEADGALAALEVLNEVSSLGNRLDRAIRAEHAPSHPKDRYQTVLLLIAAFDEARPSRLADEMNLSAGGLTYVLDRLEADGLIERSHGQVRGDRRAVVVDLTADGREVVAAIGAGFTAIKPDLRELFARVAAYATAGATA